MNNIEIHPFEPCLPKTARVLMLGSFPPPEARWSMKFYYPNKTNDMWRIMGIIFFNDKTKFLTNNGYDLPAIIDFVESKGIAMYDAAYKIIRTKGNASDKFLEVVEPTNIFAMLDKIPLCRDIVTAGEKSTELVAQLINCKTPKTGESVEFTYNNTTYTLHRMVSSSRAYPLAVEKKAEQYSILFQKIGLL